MKIISYKVQKDGSAKMSYQLSKSDEKIFKQIAKERNLLYTRKFCNSLILNGIETYLNNKEK